MFPFLEELNEEQYAAATVEQNAVVSAGAGSGKTRVLAARYAWLVTGGIAVDEILAITFTNKAANEMYRRIYRLLSGLDHPAARRAVENFRRASISTLDSFCASVARAACRRYGLSADFSSDKARVRELARSLALRFVLDNRNNPGLRELIAEKKIRGVADELFADPMFRHSPVSRPLSFAGFKERQRKALILGWNEKTAEVSRLVEGLKAEAAETLSIDFAQILGGVLAGETKAPGIEMFLAPGTESLKTARQNMEDYFLFLSGVCSINMTGKNSQRYERVKKLHGEIAGLMEELAAAANYALRWDIVEEVYPLMEEYQALFNRRRREAGILSFADVAHLAVDALGEDIELRQMYKNMFKKIMIDEFQDNNVLQRDLVYLLAEKHERREPGVPGRSELAGDKIFFVGDEKQSIYGFRGADVAVFRSLAGDFAGSGRDLVLSRNYRSRPMLIKAFNRIFGGFRHENDEAPVSGIFPASGRESAAFEASYSPLKNAGGEEGSKPLLRFAFLDKGQMYEDDPLGAEDLEAIYIAKKIRELVDGGEKVRGKDGTERPLDYGDIAVLQRTYTHQRELEKYFKIFGVPFTAEKPSGLFSDAPLNDLSALLRLLVYPSDRVAYGALLRSPLVRLSGAAFTVCMLTEGEPFGEEAESLIPVEERGAYLRGRNLYRRYRALVEKLPLTEIVSTLWYEEGYRCETLWSAQAQAFGGLYDLFFELARRTDEQGKGLPEFLDYLEDLAGREEEFEESDLPGEGNGVKLMSIHKCKGLEFPVVFIYNCAQPERSRPQGLAAYSPRWGVSIKLPSAEELPPAADYFALLEKDETRQRADAELRRLLYVAMTRAESLLYVTASLPAPKSGEQGWETAGGYTPEYLQERLARLYTPGLKQNSFLRLLLPILSGAENPPYSIEPVWVVRQDELSAARPDMGVKAAEAAPFYGAAPVFDDGPIYPPVIPASELFVPFTAAGGGVSARPAARQAEFNFNETEDRPGEFDELLEKAGIKHEEFGSAVHGIIEESFKTQSAGRRSLPPRIRAKINEEFAGALEAKAFEMAERFFASELGRRSLGAAMREVEFPILTAAGGAVVSGKIDLLFEDGGEIWIVDFKTGKIEEPLKHAGQLCLYRRAAGDIYKKPSRCWLFFVRSGRAVELDAAALDAIDPGELVAIWKKNGAAVNGPPFSR